MDDSEDNNSDIIHSMLLKVKGDKAVITVKSKFSTIPVKTH